MRTAKKKIGLLAIGLFVFVMASDGAKATDWPSWRGPQHVGMSQENATVTSWSQDGENLLWKIPVGGRSTPIVMGDRVCMIGPTGEGVTLGEHVLCVNAETGKTIWEYRFNAFHTDIVENRLGWTSLVGDPETGNIYAHGTGGEFFCFDRDGKIIWKHSLSEIYGRSSGYGGRLHTPIIDEDRVVISWIYILSNWNSGKKKAGHRYVAFDKRTGEMLWSSIPGGKPLDTTYSVPAIGVINGERMLIAGNADGQIYGMKARTGEKIWNFKLSKRGLNTSVVLDGNLAYISHSEENYDSTNMGRVVCIDASQTGDITKTGEVWRIDGLAVGYTSPALANGRLYVVTNSATMHCLDAKTGKKIWEYKLGTVAKGSPVVTADGVIYVGEVNGKFHILKDEGDKCVSLDMEHFSRPDNLSVEVNGCPAVANGRVFFMDTFETFGLGKKGAKVVTTAAKPMAPEIKPDKSKPALVQIVPAEITLAPGERVTFETRLFDIHGQPIGSPKAQWSATGVKGTIDGSSSFVAARDHVFSAGFVKATVGDLSAIARVRVSPKLPIKESFDAMTVGKQPPGWVGLDVKTKLVEKDGSVVLQKLAKSPSAKYMRMRSYSGPPIPVGYTVEADIYGLPKKGRHATLPDMGLINCRYKLILLGYEQSLRLVTYSPIPRDQVDVPFKWQGDVWYRAKLRVDLDHGIGLVRAKVWPRGEKEPKDWQATMVDPVPNLEGSPGLYGYSKGTTAVKHGASIFYDNYQVYRNE